VLKDIFLAYQLVCSSSDVWSVATNDLVRSHSSCCLNFGVLYTEGRTQETPEATGIFDAVGNEVLLFS